jgi:hypothetical protein
MVDIAREAYARKMSRFERVPRRSCSGGRERSVRIKGALQRAEELNNDVAIAIEQAF